MNSDLVNLLSSVDIAIVIVSKDLRIRRFTPMAEHLLNLIAADVGRPDLEAMVEGVVTDVKSVERDVRDAGGDWFSLRIRPYKNLDDRIDGAVVSLVDITARRKEADGRTSAMSYAEALAEEVPRPLLVLDGELRVQRAIRRIEQVEIEHDFPSIGRRRVRLNARRIEGSDSTPLLVLSIEENEHPTS